MSLSAFEGMLGNEQVFSYLSLAVENGNLPHALIFEGPQGSGKLTCALMTAAALSPKYSDKIKKLFCADVTVHGLDDGKKTIGIDQVREIKSKAYIKPQELEHRIFIIDQASTMTDAAQNALLKLLEEPPKGVYFFILCENAAMLLPTVRSRAPVLRMSVFTDRELEQYLLCESEAARALKARDEESFTMLLKASQGAIGSALERLKNKSSDSDKLRARVKELISDLISGSTVQILMFFIFSDLDRTELDSLLLTLQYAIRDMLKCKYGELSEQLFFFKTEEAEDASAEFAKSTLIELYNTTDKLRAELTVNVNARLFAVKTADAITAALKS